MMVHLENDPDTSRWTARVEIDAEQLGWLATYRERAIAEICEQLGNPPPAGQHWIEFEPGEPDLPEALLQTATQNRAAKLSRCDVWLLI
ncbi:MAG: hypothetical protein RML32_11120, partial [Gammaproteobacteria bacterium]|nr:hypothetical protein [Gammaproteobacteria bacterium]